MTSFKNGIIVLFLLTIINNHISAQSWDNVVTLNSGQKMKIDIYSNGIFRVQINRDGIFNSSLMERYSLINTTLSKANIKTDQTDSFNIFQTQAYIVKV